MGATMRNAKLPTMQKYQPNQTFPEPEEGDSRQYHSTHSDHFRDHAVSRPHLVKHRTNDPSEADHPMFGLMDPGRAASIAALPPATSHTQSSYTKPARDGYQPVRTVDPFRHTADFAWNEKWNAADQHS